MTRMLVLVLCLASAAGIAGYTYFSGERVEPAAVYVVPPRPPEAKPKPVTTNIDPSDRVALARALQRELKRVGCYGGEITGVWTTSTRMAMQAFTERVNATLPIDKPDPVLLSLVQGHQQGDVCTPNAGPTKDAKAQAPDDAAPGAAKDVAKDKADPAGVAAAAAAALALTAPAVKAEPKAKSDAADDVRPAAVKPAPREERAREKDARDTDKKGVADASKDASKNGPVPPEGMNGKRPRRSDQASKTRPPKVVRDVLKALGF
jgi:hypothetical protein